jgi:hypothetical protein
MLFANKDDVVRGLISRYYNIFIVDLLKTDFAFVIIDFLSFPIQI